MIQNLKLLLDKQKKRLNNNLIVFLTIIFLVFSLYLNALYFDFSYDDLYQINNNELVTEKKSFLSKTYQIFTSPTFPGEQYRPLVTYTYYLHFISTKLNPFYFHLFNIFFHGISGFLVFYLINFCLKSRSLSLITALIFIVHPAQIESVASIVGRTEILACFFSLLALIAYIKNNKRMLCILFFILASLCKESAFTLIGIAPLFGYFYGAINKNLKKEFITFISLFLTALALLLVRYLILKDSFIIAPPKELYFSENPLFNMSFVERVIPVSQVFGKYIFLFFFPLKLQIDYSVPLASFWNSVFSLKGFLYSFLGLFLLFILYKKRTLNFTPFLIFFVFAFGITINLLTTIGVLFAERLMYFPIIGLACYLVFLVYNKLSLKFANIIISLFICFLTIKSYLRIPVWKNNASVFKSVQKDNPTSSRANLSYGMYLHNIEKKSELAKKYFLIGYKLEPALTENARYLSDIAIQNKKLGEAKFWLKEILKYEPTDKRIKDKLTNLNKIIEKFSTSKQEEYS